METICVDASKLNKLKSQGLITDGQLVDNGTLLDIVLFQLAAKGDLAAIKYIHERLGTTPQENR